MLVGALPQALSDAFQAVERDYLQTSKVCCGLSRSPAAHCLLTKSPGSSQLHTCRSALLCSCDARALCMFTHSPAGCDGRLRLTLVTGVLALLALCVPDITSKA